MPEVQSQATIFAAGLLLPVSAPAIQDGALLVRDGRIAEIGDASLVRPFAEASENVAAGEEAQYSVNRATVGVESELGDIRKKTAGVFNAA